MGKYIWAAFVGHLLAQMSFFIFNIPQSPECCKRFLAVMQDKRMNVYSLYYPPLSSLTDLISLPNTFWYSC